MKFNQMSMQRQLLTGFALALAIFALAIGTAYWFLLGAAKNVDAVINNRYPKIMEIQSVIKRTIDNGRNLRAAAMLDKADEAEAVIARIKENFAHDSEELAKLEKTVVSVKGKALLQALKDARGKLGPMYERTFELIRSGDRARTADYLKGVGAANNALWQAAEDFNKFQEEAMAKVAGESLSGIATVQNTLLGATLAAIVLSIALALWLARSISRRLGLAVNMAQAIADGRLDSRADDDGGDEIGTLLAAMRRMQDRLGGLVGDIEQVVAAAEAGQLGERMALDGQHGFGREIAESLNRLVGTVDTSLHDIVRVAGALADGDLSQTITARYAGAFGATAEAVNRTVGALNGVVGEVRGVVNAVGEGDFSRRIETAGKQGYARDLAELLNRLCATANEALSEIARVAQALAVGDLTQQIERRYPGLFGSTANGINEIGTNLQSLIGNIAQVVALINTAAQEIASGNQDLSSRTEAQASSLEETASSMEELTSTVKQNSEHAIQAARLAGEARQVAVRGGEVVGQVVTTMGDIHEASSKIANIIGVIDGIAFQTNILALNAAVEAARAGEQGRGFAVVATEVRNLAQRSATAAKEIKGLIDDSVAKVEQGNRMVDQAGKTMQEIVGSIQQVAKIVAEISEASHEQSSGIEQVGIAVSQMDQVTQQNAALVEEAAAAAESLDEQAHVLAAEVGKFKLVSGSLAVAPAAAARPANGVARPAIAAPRGGGRRLAAPPRQLPAAPAGDDWETF